MRSAFRRFLAVAGVTFAAVLFSAGFAAASGRPLVDAQWLSANAKKVVVVDVRKSGDYTAGHIPGAISIPLGTLQGPPDAVPYPIKQEEKTLGADGLTIGKDVVLYGAGREMAFREYWIFDYLGMRNIHVLDGGIEGWKGQSSTEQSKLPAAKFVAKPDLSKYATTAYVRAHLKNKGVILVDVRTPGEYRGTDVRALRGGHIPGAINMNYANNFQKGTTFLKPAADLKKIYAKLDRRKEIITYCQTGSRAANAFFVLKMLGFRRVRDYVPSWIEWGSNESLPAQDVTYFNFVPVIKAIKSMQK
ncbi:MAG: sulfurtransferase [Nitrospiraceae bacterium]|nr:sulfurtransferase [Nitrospiraceae bacterium]